MEREAPSVDASVVEATVGSSESVVGAAKTTATATTSGSPHLAAMATKGATTTTSATGPRTTMDAEVGVGARLTKTVRVLPAM